MRAPVLYTVLASSFLACAAAQAQSDKEPPLLQPTLIYKAPRAASPSAVPRVLRERSARAVPESDRFYDETLPEAGILQRAGDALADFPRDRTGNVDWSAALRSGRIHPRADLHGKREIKLHDGDVIMRNTRQMPWVRFPHRAHSEWLECQNCHPTPFEARAAANPVNMETIFRGGACGVCHGRVAFAAVSTCERCHSVPRPGAKSLYDIPEATQ